MPVNEGTDTGNMVLSYKLGVKDQLINSLRGVFGSAYPDKELANRVKIISEYPLDEVAFPVIVVKFVPGEIKNVGIGSFTISDSGQTILNWKFTGTVTFEVFAKTPEDRDMLITGLINLFAFAPQIPGFSNFQTELLNGEFVTITLGTQSFHESGDSVDVVPWGDAQVEKAYTDTITLDAYGEFSTNPYTGFLVRIARVNLYPYGPNQSAPNINI